MRGFWLFLLSTWIACGAVAGRSHSVAGGPSPDAKRTAGAPARARAPSRPTAPRPPIDPDSTEEVWTASVSGTSFKSEDARQEALRRAADRVQSEFDLNYPVSIDEVKQWMITNDQDQPKDLGEFGEGREVTLTLKLTAETARHLAEREREFRVHQRMLASAKIVFLLVGGFGVLSLLMRLDDWSKGYLSKALIAVAVAAAAAGLFGIRYMHIG